MTNETREVRKRLVFWAAWLIVLALITGIWAAATLTGTVKVPEPRLALGAHLSGLMGGLWMLGIAFSFEFLECPPARLRLISNLAIVANWGNWSITVLASLLGVTGLSFTHDPANNLVAVLLQIGVVVPSLAAAIVWAMSFTNLGPRSPRPDALFRHPPA